MLIDSLVSPIEHLSRDICLSQGPGLPKDPYIQRYPKAMPPSIPHNSQLPPPIEVTLNILELSRGELSLAHHFNPMALSPYG